MDLYVVLLTFISSLLCFVSVAKSYVLPITDVSEDACDWTLWDDTVTQGVRNVIANCGEGHVNWQHPYGAIRVIFQLPSGVGSHPFYEACFRAKSRLTSVKISLESEDSELSSITVLDQTAPVMKKEICFTSPLQKRVVLFIETEHDSQSAMSGRFELDYDIQRIKSMKNPASNTEDPDDSDCRPCTDAELLQAACSSDFVVQGSMNHVLHQEVYGETLVQLDINKIHRQRHLLFTKNDVASLTSGGEIIVPRKCGVRKGSGQFLFMGRVRLRRALLQCAPRMEEFNLLWEKAVQVGVNPCTLEE